MWRDWLSKEELVARKLRPDAGWRHQTSLGDAPDFDLVCRFFCLGEVKGGLEPEPRFGNAAKSFIEPDRHLAVTDGKRSHTATTVRAISTAWF
jgi:hypothetical protein